MNVPSRHKKNRNSNDYNRVHPRSLDKENIARIQGCDWRDCNTYIFPGGVTEFSWLAWEALRRNAFFQEFCEKYDEWRDDLKLYQWGLARFKDYRENIVATDQQTWPDWTLTKPTYVVDMVSAKRYGPPTSKIGHRPLPKDFTSIKVYGGHVAFVFNLDQIHPFRSIVNRQLIEASRELKRLLKICSSDDFDKRSVAIPHKSSVIPLLRLADAMLDECGLTREEISEIIFADELSPQLGSSGNGAHANTKKKDYNAALKDMSKKIKGAADLIYRRGYAGLLVKDSE